MTTTNFRQVQNHLTDMDMDKFINRIKNEDVRNLRISKIFQWIYWVLVPLYCLLYFIEYYEDRSLLNHFSELFYVLSLIVFLIIFRMNTKKFKQIDYSLPTIELMQKAASRYRIINGKTLLLVIIALLLMDAGLTFRFYRDHAVESGIIVVLWVQVAYFLVMGAAISIGMIIWRIKHKPLYDQARAIVRELEQ